MKALIKTDGKRGVLEINGNPQEVILYLNDRPIQYSWYAEVGSTWRYHIAQGLNKQAIHVNQWIEGLLKRGIGNEGDFLAVAEYFNDFFKAGTYEYGYYALPQDAGWIDIPEEESYQHFDYYGGCLDISPTQNLVDDRKVKDYQQAIVQGARPIVILLHIKNSRMFFILDGHHKFCAYGKAGVKPSSIIITKQENDFKTIKQTADLALTMGCDNKEYLNWMKCQKSDLSNYKNQQFDLEKVFSKL
jgi:hypothetical protein